MKPLLLAGSRPTMTRLIRFDRTECEIDLLSRRRDSSWQRLLAVTTRRTAQCEPSLVSGRPASCPGLWMISHTFKILHVLSITASSDQSDEEAG